AVEERRDRAADHRRRRGAAAVRANMRVRIGAEACARHEAGDGARPGEEGSRADHRPLHPMKLIVTGSIAFDYLMSFPGKFTEHFLPEHLARVSLSFLVDTMDKRRGGCAPNIAYTLALLGERPRLMAAAGEDFGEYRQWLEAAGVDTWLVV